MFGQVWTEATGGTAVATRASALKAPKDWRGWLTTMFPSYVAHPFAARHEEFWRWVWSVERGKAPAHAFVGIWPRGGGKSTSAELAAVALGCRGKRRYALYVRDTQDRADDSVQNIAGLLEAKEVGRYYPQHADRMVGKFGNSKGWRRNRLRTAGGFTVDAIGLDTAARGAKLDDQRPDFIILDDIDGKHDSPATTAKKIAIITTSLLPAGSEDVGTLAIQNLITGEGFFARLVTGEADYLAARVVSGPHPAIVGLETEQRLDDETGTVRDVIVKGTATWAGQSLEKCQRDIDRFGLGSFEKECQHDVFSRSDKLALRFADRHVEDMTDDDARRLVRIGTPFAGIDFGAWRFFFQLRVADTHGVVRQVAEYFSQRENLETRARAIHAICTHYGVSPRVRFRGDAANPTDITELNQAFKRISSPYRVKAVRMEAKGRKAAVEKLNDLLDRNAIRYRRDVTQAVALILSDEFERPVTEFLTWKYGLSASNPGTEKQGSRLRWELAKWGYPVPKEGEAQDQDPDDNTADGADGIAAERYAVMSYLRAAVEPESDDLTADEVRALIVEDGRRMQKLSSRKQRRQEIPTDPMFGGY